MRNLLQNNIDPTYSTLPYELVDTTLPLGLHLSPQLSSRLFRTDVVPSPRHISHITNPPTCPNATLAPMAWTRPSRKLPRKPVRCLPAPCIARLTCLPSSTGQAEPPTQRPQSWPLLPHPRLPSCRSDHPYERLLWCHECALFDALLPHPVPNRQSMGRPCLYAFWSLLRFLRWHGRAYAEKEQSDGS